MTPPRKTGRELDEGGTFPSTRWRDLRDGETALDKTNGEIADLQAALKSHKDSYEGFKAEIKEEHKERQKLDRELAKELGALNAKVTIMLAALIPLIIAVVGGVITLFMKR